MKMKRRWIAGVHGVLFVPVMVFAVSGWTTFASVAELTPTIQGRFLVKLNVAENPSGCRSKDTFYQDFSIPGAEEMFNTLLEAVIAGKVVRVFVTGRCELNGYSEISSVGISP